MHRRECDMCFSTKLRVYEEQRRKLEGKLYTRLIIKCRDCEYEAYFETTSQGGWKGLG